MSTIGQSGRSNGVSPQQTILQTAAQAGVGQNTPLQQVAPANLNPQDQIKSSSGAQGKATSIDIVSNSANSEKIKQLLARGDFDEIANWINQLKPDQLGSLDLSGSEIQQIAQGLGQGSWRANLPMMASFSETDHQAVEKLIRASNLSVNQKVSHLKTLVGPDAVFNLVRASSVNDLKDLSWSNRNLVLAVLDPGNSVWSDVTQATNEAVNRRIMGNSQQIEDGLASKILLSSPENRLPELINNINQFNRDDVVFDYVMKLSSKDIAALSDATKQMLLTHLVDSSISLPFLKIDLNSVANLDETLSMTFKEHAQAAHKLYAAMKTETQQSAAVQETVQKSDLLMQQIQGIETALKQDIQGGKINLTKIAEYRQQLQAFQSTDAKPEVKAKVQELMQTLSQLQQGLAQTQLQKQDLTLQLKATEAGLDQAQGHLDQLKTQLTQGSASLKREQGNLNMLQERLMKQYEQVFSLSQNVEGAGSEYQQVLQEMAQLMQSSQSTSSKLAPLNQLVQKLGQMQSQLKSQGQGLARTQTALEQAQTQLTSLQGNYQQAANKFSESRQTLQSQKTQLQKTLSSYSQKIEKLEQDLSRASNQFKDLSKDLPATQKQAIEQDLSSIRQEISEHRSSLSTGQQQFEQTLIPAALQIEQQAQVLAPEQAALTEKMEQAETQAGTIENLWQAATEVVEKTKSALSGLVEKVSAFTADARQRLQSMSSTELQQTIAQAEQMQAELKQTLQAEGRSPAEVESELQQLGAISSQASAILKQVNAVQKQRESLLQASSQLSQNRSQTEKELAGAKEELEAAKTGLSQAQSVLKNTAAELSQLQTKVGTYQTSIKDYEQQLAKLNSANKDSKSGLKDQLAKSGLFSNGMPDLSQIPQILDLKQNFSSVDQQRQEIQTQLAALQGKLSAVQGQMSEQTENLKLAETSLKSHQTKLQTAQQEVATQRLALQKLNDQNQGLVSDLTAFMRPLESAPQSTEISQALGKLSGLKTQLEAEISQSQVAVEAANGEDIRSIRLQTELRETLAQLASQQDQIHHFQTQQVQPSEAQATQMAQTLAQLQAKQTELETNTRQILDQIRSGDYSTDIKSLYQQAKTAFEQADSEIALTAASEIASFIRQNEQGIHSLDLALTTAGEIVGKGRALVSRSQDIRQQIGLNITSIGGFLNSSRQKVEQAKNNLLETQGRLLDRRRQLGIQTGGYQDYLQRYEQLLQQGNSLNTDQRHELQSLEMNLGQIEQAEMQDNKAIRDELMGLNSLKAEVNQQVHELKASLRVLAQIGSELLGTGSEIQQQKQALEAEYKSLTTSRDEVQQKLEELKALKANNRGVTDYDQNIAQLENLLGQLNQKITETETILNDLASVALDINLEAGAVELQVLTLNNLLNQLNLLLGAIDDLVLQAESLLQESDQQIRQIKNLQTQINENPVTETRTSMPQQSQSSEASMASTDSQEQAQFQKQRFGQQLSNLLTFQWASQQRQTQTKREQDHQAQRETQGKDLKARLELSKQLNQEVELAILKQQPLEQITSYLVQKAHDGLSTSGQSTNIVGVTKTVHDNRH